MSLTKNKMIVIVTGILCLGISGFSLAQESGILTVEVIGMESNEGVVRIALFKSKEVFENFDARKSAPPGAFPAYKRGITKISNHTAKWKFQEIPYGEYVVATYHDQNNNGILDSNFLGIPKEAFGFSNDARGIVGAPDYDKAKIIFIQKNQTVMIRVK